MLDTYCFFLQKVKGQGQGQQKHQKHIFGHNSASNYDRDLQQSALDSSFTGTSYVTLTLTFDLHTFSSAQGQS